MKTVFSTLLVLSLFNTSAFAQGRVSNSQTQNDIASGSSDSPSPSRYGTVGEQSRPEQPYKALAKCFYHAADTLKLNGFQVDRTKFSSGDMMIPEPIENHYVDIKTKDRMSYHISDDEISVTRPSGNKVTNETDKRTLIKNLLTHSFGNLIYNIKRETNSIASNETLALDFKMIMDHKKALCVCIESKEKIDAAQFVLNKLKTDKTIRIHEKTADGVSISERALSASDLSCN